MKQLLRKHILTLTLVTLGGIVGLTIYLSRPPIAIWYVIYQFNMADLGELEDVVKVDTLFLYEDVLLRNYTGSYADKDEAVGFKRQELKVYADPNQTKDEVTKFAVRAIGAGKVSVFDTIFKEKQRKKRVILDMLLLGFFIGIVIEFIRSMQKKPSAE